MDVHGKLPMPQGEEVNYLRAQAKGIKEAGEIALVSLEAHKESFSALMLDASNLEGLEVEAWVEMLFKETEVILATIDSKVSARNSFVGEIIEMIEGEILTQVTLDFHGEKIRSIITHGAAEELGLRVGAKARWFIKANEMTLRTE